MHDILRRINSWFDPTTEQIQRYLQARPRQTKFGPYLERFNRRDRS